ncbi:single-stranded DNA-binding protein [Streptomyces sp. NPDC053542]|uniref:single-stranded DNA-binding protein n=1 Tax=Streptomyces sp. NPDC053542 TaxID=3365710 RepID=UPI0037D0606B
MQHEFQARSRAGSTTEPAEIQQAQEAQKKSGTGEMAMTDTMVTLTGNAATAVEHRYTKDGAAAARFRMACTPRRFDREQGRWTDGTTSFYTVRAWRTLADNLAASVAVGEPLVVRGRLTVREGEHPPERGGGRWFAAEVDAVTIGHDLTRGTAAFRRAARARTETLPQSGQPQPGQSQYSSQSGPPPFGAEQSDAAATAALWATAPPDKGVDARDDAGPPVAERPDVADVTNATGRAGAKSGDFTSGTRRSGTGSGDSVPVIAAQATGIGDSMVGSDSPEKVPVS